MDNNAALQQQISQTQRRSAVAQDEINWARAQISMLEEEIRRLQAELAELGDFHRQTNNDFSKLRSQADERKGALIGLGSIPNVSVFQSLASLISEEIDGKTKGSLDIAQRDITQQINRASSDIQAEIDRLQARIASFNQTINRNMSIIRQNDASISTMRNQMNSST